MIAADSSSKPIFLVTHPRAISTAFERVFLTREDDIACVHEPFSDAYHWGPEKLSERYEAVEKLRVEKGLDSFTYQSAFQLINDARIDGKRVFVKDMAKCLMPLPDRTPSIVSSLQPLEIAARDTLAYQEELDFPNPTVIPPELLSRFHYTFLIRHPQRSIPSLYECSTPPKSSLTGWHGFKATDAGYREMRILFDYLLDIGQIGPNTSNEICIVDADDLLASPKEVVENFCSSVGISYDRSSLTWGTTKDWQRAKDAFKNWAPFHDVVLNSTSIKATPVKKLDLDADFVKWTQKYGKEAAELILENVQNNLEDYLYLRQFTAKPRSRSEVESLCLKPLRGSL